VATIENLISGGYFLVWPTDRKPWMSELLPERISSVSECICDNGPNVYWAWGVGDWHDAPTEAVVWADRLGIAREHLPKLRAWLIEADRVGDLQYPSVLTSPDVACRLLGEFGVDASGLSLLGIAADAQQAAKYIADEDSQRGPLFAPSGIRTLLGRELAPVAGGEPLGYEVCGDGHSWLCNSLESDAFDLFGVRPNAEGFISTIDAAERVAAWANDDASGAEPGPWRPWLISRYELVGSPAAQR
jgi:hypothetical protein